MQVRSTNVSTILNVMSHSIDLQMVRSAQKPPANDDRPADRCKQV